MHHYCSCERYEEAGSETGLAYALDDIADRLRESERLFPGDSTLFFDNPEYAHLHVQVAEVINIFKLIKAELEERYGSTSSKIAILESIRGGAWNRKNSVFRRSIEHVAKLRGFVHSTSSEPSAATAASINFTIHGDMVGSAVGGTTATTHYANSNSVAIDPQRLDELAALLADVTVGRPLSPEHNADINEIKHELDKLKASPSAEHSKVRGVLSKVTSFGAEILTKPTAAIVAETAKRLLCGLP